MPLSARRVGESFVAEISGLDLSQDLDDAAWTALHRAYLTHKVLYLRGQTLTADQLYRFGERFGEIEPHTVRMYRHPERPGITLLSNRVEMGRPKGIRDAGSHWHSDYSYKAVPANVTILYALEIPDEGGDTLFCDMEAAWEALPDDLKSAVAGKQQAIQYRWHRDREHPESRWKLLSPEEQAESPEVVHPVVRTHPETGRKALFVFPGITSGVKGILGMDATESDEILRRIWEHCTQERFVYRYKWHGPGDLLLWDNRCTMHHATTDVLPPDRYRTLWRINTRGTVPV